MPSRARHLSGITLVLVVSSLVVAGAGPGPRALASPSTDGSAVAAEHLWSSRYDGPGCFGGGFDNASAISMSPDDKTVYVTGSSCAQDTFYDYATVAYDAFTGAQLWVSRYDNVAGDTEDSATDLAVSPDGARVFVTGTSFGSGTLDDMATIAYDAATGTQLWASRYSSPGSFVDVATEIEVAPNGSAVCVAGIVEGLASDYATVAYDPSTGAQLWVSTYGSGTGNDYAYALKLSSDSTRLFVSGRSQQTLLTDDDFATVAYDATTGAQLWVSRYDGFGGTDSASDLGVSPDASMVFVTGSSNRPLGGADYATVAYDAASGAQLWASRSDGPKKATRAAKALGVSGDGSTVFVAGNSSIQGTGYRFATVAYDARTGVQLWISRTSGSPDPANSIDALAVVPDGSAIFVAGTMREDYACIEYDALTGAELLGGRIGGRGFDQASGLALGTDGSVVFVAGTLQAGSGSDYGTVAFTS